MDGQVQFWTETEILFDGDQIALDPACCCFSGCCENHLRPFLGGDVLEGEVIDSPLGCVPVGTKIDINPMGTGWQSDGCLDPYCVNGFEISCFGVADPTKRYLALDFSGTICLAGSPCPDEGAEDTAYPPPGGIKPAFIECDPFEAIWIIDIPNEDVVPGASCDCCYGGRLQFTLRVTKKFP